MVRPSYIGFWLLSGFVDDLLNLLWQAGIYALLCSDGRLCTLNMWHVPENISSLCCAGVIISKFLTIHGVTSIAEMYRSFVAVPKITVLAFATSPRRITTWNPFLRRLPAPSTASCSEWRSKSLSNANIGRAQHESQYNGTSFFLVGNFTPRGA